MFSIGVLTFSLLLNMQPYAKYCVRSDPFASMLIWSPEYTAEQRYRCIFRNGLELEDYHGPFLSASCLDFLDRLLCLEDDRMSVQEAIEHPWLSEKLADF